MFDSIIGNSITIGGFIACMLTSIILGIIVSFIHMKTSRYSKNFAITLAILPTLVTVVILLVNGNLGTAVAIVGAFTLVRFRSIPGNSKEILAVFFSMAIGLAVGTGYLVFASIFTLAVSLLILLLHFTRFGEVGSSHKILKIIVPEDMDYTTMFDEEFKEYLKDHKLITAKTINLGSMFELTYEVQLKDDINEKDFIDKLRVKNGNLKIILTHPMIEEAL